MTQKFLFTVLTITIFVGSSFSQERNNEYIVSPAVSSACENNRIYFDETLNEANSTKQKIFAIFRAGKNETEIINAKRLIYVKKFLQMRRDWNKSGIIYARGEKTGDEGKIEFYIGSKLYLVVTSPKNKTPCMDCCDGGLDYPQNLNKVKKHSKKKRNQKLT